MKRLKLMCGSVAPAMLCAVLAGCAGESANGPQAGGEPPEKTAGVAADRQTAALDAKNSRGGASSDKNSADKNSSGANTSTTADGSADVRKNDGTAARNSAVKSEMRTLLPQLVSHNAEQRKQASRQLDAIAAEGSIRQPLIDLMTDRSADVRRGAAFRLLGEFDKKDEALIAAYRAALKDADSKVRQMALQAILRLPAESLQGSLDELIALMSNTQESDAVRTRVIRSLGNMGETARPASDALRAILQQEQSTVVRTAVMAAITEVAERPVAEAALAEIVRSEKNKQLRLLAIRRLRCPRLEDAMLAVGQLMQEDDEELSDAAAQCLAGTGSRAIPALMVQLDAKSPRARRLAIVALGTMQFNAKIALPKLEKMQKEDSQADVRRLAAQAVKIIRRSQKLQAEKTTK